MFGLHEYVPEMFIPVLPPASPRQNIVPRWGRRPFGMGKIIPVLTAFNYISSVATKPATFFFDLHKIAP